MTIGRLSIFQMPDMEEREGILQRLTRDDLIAAQLPHPPVRRWSPQRKLRVISAVSSGAVALNDICQHYRISLAEFGEWQSALKASGMPGLHVRRKRRHPYAEHVMAEASRPGQFHWKP